MNIIAEEGVRIVFTSAGNPATWTGWLKERGITVVHVVSNLKFALKCAQVGVDAIVAEGFEAGGHNGREETTTMCLIPMIRAAVALPLIAAGGIGSGPAMAAALCLGAEGVQVGSRFAATLESSAHPNFKNAILAAGDGDTKLTLKELTPVRLIKNHFYHEVEAAYARGASKEELQQLLGRGRAKKGMFEGDLDEGELEIGQVSAAIHDLPHAETVVREMMEGCRETLKQRAALC
jgi:enoyl-[acyl-carrier protein] reductase II